MLSLTDQAATILRKIPHAFPDPGTAGLRIAVEEGYGDHLRVHTVAAAEPEDQVLECDGGRLFLGPVAALRLGDKRLDARLGERGRIEFRAFAPTEET